MSTEVYSRDDAACFPLGCERNKECGGSDGLCNTLLPRVNLKLRPALRYALTFPLLDAANISLLNLPPFSLFADNLSRFPLLR